MINCKVHTTTSLTINLTSHAYDNLKVERDSHSSTSTPIGNSSEITEVNSEVDEFESSSSTIICRSTCSNQEDINFCDDNTAFDEPITNLQVCKYIHIYVHTLHFYFIVYNYLQLY